MKRRPFVVIVTGLSGAGYTTALNALADSGMYPIDNLPIELFEETIALYESGRIPATAGLALGMDVREPGFVARFPELHRKVAERMRVELIFLTANESAITTRFSTTRRKHPLLGPGETLQEAIADERELLSPLEETADVVFDTSNWSPHMLARAVEQRFSKDLPPRVLHVTVTSFGFKYGQHTPLDSMFDVRFLDNPYFVPGLKALSGLEAEVRDYIFSFAAAREMFAKIDDMLRFLLPLYYLEGKHYFRLGIGCSGGRHRSVAFAEEIGRSLLASKVANVVMTVIHRDIEN